MRYLSNGATVDRIDQMQKPFRSELRIPRSARIAGPRTEAPCSTCFGRINLIDWAGIESGLELMRNEVVLGRVIKS